MKNKPSQIPSSLTLLFNGRYVPEEARQVPSRLCCTSLVWQGCFESYPDAFLILYSSQASWAGSRLFLVNDGPQAGKKDPGASLEGRRKAHLCEKEESTAEAPLNPDQQRWEDIILELVGDISARGRMALFFDDAWC